MDVCLLWALCVVRSLRRADHSSRESYWLWCVIVCDLESSWMRRPWSTVGCRAKNKQNNSLMIPSSLLTETKLSTLLLSLINTCLSFASLWLKYHKFTTSILISRNRCNTNKVRKTMHLLSDPGMVTPWGVHRTWEYRADIIWEDKSNCDSNGNKQTLQLHSARHSVHCDFILPT